MSSGPTIGVFDSGFGGLTVLRALLPLVSSAHYIYLGDTARLPYGSKSRETIARYAVESAHFLEARGADLLVIACNTATALALDDIRHAVNIPVIGVIEPGARTALEALPQIRVPHVPLLGHGSAPNPDVSTHPQILVLATTATVQSHAYRAECDALGMIATEVACPLLVPLVEEGWTGHHVTREVLRIYLSEALTECAPHAVLLGCTHYPLIAAAIEAMLRELGSDAIVIDSAAATARVVARTLNGPTPSNPSQPATFECFATDSVEKFQRLGSIFLGQPIPKVELLDLGG
jgi:glutamate racemase